MSRKFKVGDIVKSTESGVTALNFMSNTTDLHKPHIVTKLYSEQTGHGPNYLVDIDNVNDSISEVWFELVLGVNLSPEDTEKFCHLTNL
jgi:hypothetical protein